MDSTLARLALWHASQCNGEREHHQGITITTTDNPGWWVKVDLTGTPLLGKPFAEIAEGVDARRHPRQDRWLSCYVVDGVWNGAGDLTRIEDLLRHFLDWAGA